MHVDTECSCFSLQHFILKVFNHIEKLKEDEFNEHPVCRFTNCCVLINFTLFLSPYIYCYFFLNHLEVADTLSPHLCLLPKVRTCFLINHKTIIALKNFITNV